MKDDELEIEFRAHTLAIFIARKAAGLPLPERDPDDPWWLEGPHVEKDGRRYYVHAIGCFRAELGRAIDQHPDWHLISAVVRGDRVDLHGFEHPLITLAEVRRTSDSLTPDQIRLAVDYRRQRSGSRGACRTPSPDRRRGGGGRTSTEAGVRTRRRTARPTTRALAQA